MAFAAVLALYLAVRPDPLPDPATPFPTSTTAVAPPVPDTLPAEDTVPGPPDATAPPTTTTAGPAPTTTPGTSEPPLSVPDGVETPDTGGG